MQRTVGAILFVLGACAPTIDPGSSIETLETGPFEGSALNSQGNPRNDLTGDKDLEWVRRVASGIFETAFEFCARRSHEGNVADADLQSGCGYSLEIDPDARPNAFIRGNRIRLTQGMVRIAHRDAELAFVLAHEVAHGLLRHGSAPFWKSRKSIELEADNMAVEILARAGYPVESAADLLRRMARALPRRERPDPSYPSYKARADAVRSMVGEIRGHSRIPSAAD